MRGCHRKSCGRRPDAKTQASKDLAGPEGWKQRKFATGTETITEIDTFEYQLGQRPLPRSKNSFYQCDGEHRQKRCSPWHVTPLAADSNQYSQCQAVKAVKAEAKNDREMMVCTIAASILCYSPWLREFQYFKIFQKATFDLRPTSWQPDANPNGFLLTAGEAGWSKTKNEVEQWRP